MRGLTPEERHVLTCPIGAQPTTLRNILDLKKRGLVEYDHHGDHAMYGVTPLAALDLRLDAAARAIAGVTT